MDGEDEDRETLTKRTDGEDSGEEELMEKTYIPRSHESDCG